MSQESEIKNGFKVMRTVEKNTSLLHHQKLKNEIRLRLMILNYFYLWLLSHYEIIIEILCK